MLVLLNGIALFGAVLVLAPAIWILLACIAGSLPNRTKRPEITDTRPSLAVLIPAHNEAATIGATLEAVLREMRRNDRILVVADNCTDETARVAARAGVDVVERNDPQRRGKGFALDHGLRHLTVDPPQIVVIVDADCNVGPGTLDVLAREAVRHNGPVQAMYLLYPPPQPRMRDYLSSLAFTMKGAARAAGLARLGLPCLLGGTGMAVPWDQIRTVPLASGNIVEDMQLGLDLAIAGHLPRYCPAGLVTGSLPQCDDAAITQRTRWEHGHLHTILRQVPRLVRASLIQRSPKLLALAMELSVPPLTLYVLLIGVSLGTFGVAAASGLSIAPVVVTLLTMVLLLGAVLLSWWRFAQGFVPAQAFLAIPLYVLSKIPMYLRFLVRRQTTWVRTGRGGGGTLVR